MAYEKKRCHIKRRNKLTILPKFIGIVYVIKKVRAEKRNPTNTS